MTLPPADSGYRILMTSQHTLESDVVYLLFKVILEDKTGLALILPQVLMATQALANIFEGLDFPQADIGILRTASHIEDLLIEDRTEGKVPHRVHMTQEGELVLKDLLVG